MSNFKAIAGVSRTLRTLLLDRMEAAPKVTIAPPDVQVSGVDGRRVNLFLYEVTENGYLKNQEIPGQGHPAAYGHPPLSLNLHYLITAFDPAEQSQMGGTSEEMAQELLGDAMRVLHDYAIVTEDLKVTKSIIGLPPVGDPILDTDLRGEYERVKLSLQPLGMDELNKIWTALTVKYRLSVAYEVSVVQIESRLSRRLAMPVKTRRVHITITQRPEISVVYKTPPVPGDPIGDPRVRLLQQITIEGQNFTASKTWVKIGGLEPIRVTPAPDDKIQIAVPDKEYPIDADHPAPPRQIPVEQRLQPGPQTVEVLTERETEVIEGGLDKGAVVSDKRVLGSNQAVFMLLPEISSINPANGSTATLLTVTGKRLYKEGLKSFVLVGDVAIEVRKPRKGTPALPGDPWVEPTDTEVQVPLTALSTAVSAPPLAGQYPVRILVNGAQSTEEGIIFTLMP